MARYPTAEGWVPASTSLLEQEHRTHGVRVPASGRFPLGHSGQADDTHVGRYQEAEMPDKRPSVKNEKQYEALKDKGMSKERAARIANSPDASRHGGESSGSGGDSRQGGTTAQKKAAGRKGGKATARKS